MKGELRLSTKEARRLYLFEQLCSEQQGEGKVTVCKTLNRRTTLGPTSCRRNFQKRGPTFCSLYESNRLDDNECRWTVANSCKL